VAHQIEVLVHGGFRVKFEILTLALVVSVFCAPVMHNHSCKQFLAKCCPDR